ncbi:MAG: hypothetical protein KY475_06745 [Planctomycetes bacterium]|nr:hypothetical protein [Planctomycetota bacterium]
MVELSQRNFGLLIAYLIPGFVVVWGAGYFSETAQSWLSALPDQAPTVGGFLYLTVASVAAGVTVSAIRWAIIDRLHHWTGVRMPDWDFADYPSKLAAFDAIVQDHYRYYQFYANMLVAVVFLFVARLATLPETAAMPLWMVTGFVLLETVLVAGSRDALRRYYTRGTRLLGVLSETRSSGGDDASRPGSAAASAESGDGSVTPGRRGAGSRRE